MSLFSKISRLSSRKCPTVRRGRRAGLGRGLESLENRQLLAVTASFLPGSQMLIGLRRRAR